MSNPERKHMTDSVVVRTAALAMLGLMTYFYPPNTNPGQWAREKQAQIRSRR